jgi:adenylosuccinate synthase
VIVGANWGDEGKGRMVDYFASNADYVVRYQGGSNAGHTIVTEKGKFALRLVPSGIFYPHVVNVIGPGTVVNLESLGKEIADLKSKGIDVSSANLKLSDLACICFPFHMLQDGYEEERLGKKMFGSTRQGIAPAYGDRYMKYGVPVGALRDQAFVAEQLGRCLDLKNLLFTRVYDKPAVDKREMLDWVEKFGSALMPYVTDTSKLLNGAVADGKRVLLEAQLGALRDVFYGIYPYTTSSNPIASFAYLGAGIFSDTNPRVTAVVKAFSTCVGEGPFVTEMSPDIAEPFRQRTGEYGAATGRPRRIGHFDAVATRYGVRVQNASEVALTKLDNLSGVPTLKICTHYTIDGERHEDFPLFGALKRAEPAYVECPGWEEDIRGARTYDALPQNARKYVETIQEMIGVKVQYISVGPARDDLITM